MSAMTTRAFSSSSASTIPRPMPPAPPVTTATRPLRSSNALPPVIETRVAAHVNAPGVTPPVGKRVCDHAPALTSAPGTTGRPEERDGRVTTEAQRPAPRGVSAARRDAYGAGLAAAPARQRRVQARRTGPRTAPLAPVPDRELARRDRRPPRLRRAALDSSHLRGRADGHGVAEAHVRSAGRLGLRRDRRLLQGRDRPRRRRPRSGHLVRPPFGRRPAPDDVAVGRSAPHRGDG